MEIRNTPILVRVIRFQSLLGVVYLWLNHRFLLSSLSLYLETPYEFR